ncbi:MAG: type II toxin-antitoxin system RelE/ParE family toxin [Thermoanaerobaculia bacterium]
MARKIRWTAHASLLLDEVGQYLFQKSPAGAATVVEALLDAAESLALFPERGRVVPELKDPDCRELLVRDYRLVYRVNVDYVLIVALVHGSRDFRSWWRPSLAARLIQPAILPLPDKSILMSVT